MSSPPPAPARRFPHSRTGRVALAVLAALALLACTFRWNWLRPALQHYVLQRSGRALDFDELHVRFRHGLDPTIELRNLTIQNAPWAASKAPFIHAGRIALTLSWRTIHSDKTVIEMIELDDAQVDMERLADGRRNWRITRPDDIGPPHVLVLALAARNSRLHTVHGGLGLEADAQITDLAAATTLAGHADLPLTRRLVFSGHYQGHAFDGEALVSDVLAFGATPRRFALQGSARLGGLKLDAAGLSNDVHALGDLDCDIALATDGAGPLWPLPDALARVRPLAARGHVTHTGERWQAPALRLSAGRRTTLVADIDFTGRAHQDTPRRTLKATLRDAVLDLDDLSLLRGKTPPDEKTLPGTRADADHALSTQPLPFDRLREFDADVDLRQARLVGSERAMAQTLRAHATLEAGALRVAPFELGLADGQVNGTLQLDAAHAPATMAIDLSARGLRVDQLSATLAANGALAGTISGRASVKTRGESSRALVADATGSVTLSLAPGATVSKRLDAKLGLNGGEWLRTLFDKSIHAAGSWHDVKIKLEPSTGAEPARCAPLR